MSRRTLSPAARGVVLHCHGCGARICDHHAAAWGHHRAEAHLAEDDES